MTKPTTRQLIEAALVSCSIIAVCVVAIWMSLSFEKMPPILKRGIQPADFPQIICVTIIGMTLFMMWRDPIRITERMGSRTLVTMLFMAGFAALTAVDLFLALGVFAGVLALYWGERRFGSLLLVTLVVPAVVFFLFDQVFEIRFPRGLLTSLWYR